MSHFCGDTDTPVLDFWWHLLWVSKPEWAALFKLGGGIHFHVPWDSPLVQHLLILLVASIAAKPYLPHTCKALVGFETRSYHAAAHSVRSGRQVVPHLCGLSIPSLKFSIRDWNWLVQLTKFLNCSVLTSPRINSHLSLDMDPLPFPQAKFHCWNCCPDFEALCVHLAPSNPPHANV